MNTTFSSGTLNKLQPTNHLLNLLQFVVRGKVKEFYSDRGTNFVGGVRELGIKSFNVEDSSLKSFLLEQGTAWKFYTPPSSHMGGAWERLIGITRRILDSILFDAKHTRITHEVLSNFMAEATAIINVRPLFSVSTDSDSSLILSPSTLLTQKSSTPVEDFHEFGVF